jgi:hypothetical protein
VEIINLRRARKAKQRAELAAQAEANLAKHGISKRQRDIVKARAEKAAHLIKAHKLDK